MTELNLKVLVVGDEALQRDALALALGDRGMLPRVASTLELASAAAQEQPDLVILDVQSMHADEVGGMLRKAAVGCPVLVLSDRPGPELDAFAARSGTAGAIHRTGLPRELAGEVEELLARSLGSQEPVREEVDFVGLARRSTRAEFVAAWPCPFLVSVSSLVSQAEKKATANILDPEMFEAIQDAVRERLSGPASGRRDTSSGAAIALAVRGRINGAVDTISVGRALGVDVLIDHATISKHHASFLRAAGGLEVNDAGSRNGTWLSGRLLKPNGRPSPVASGDTIRFGELEFTFLSSAAAWDVLRANVR
jgi:CheY-like chemotaxis protein